MPALTMWISGLCRLVEMGRTRPKKSLPGGVSDANNAGLGALGKAAKTAGAGGGEREQQKEVGGGCYRGVRKWLTKREGHKRYVLGKGRNPPPPPTAKK